MKEIKTTDGRKLAVLAKALNRDLIVFDLEHTSGSYESFGIMEMACLRIQPSGEITRAESLFNPEASIQPFISKLTGIWPYMVKAKPKWKAIGAPFVQSNQEAIWVGFNSRASDVKRIQALHRLQGLDVPAFAYQIDLMRLGKRMGGHTGTLSELTRVHAPHAVEEDAHRAYADVKMTAALLESWLDYALNNLDSLLEPVSHAEPESKTLKTNKEASPVRKEVKPIDGATAPPGSNHGKKWSDNEVEIVRHAVEARQVDVVNLSNQIGRSMFAIALKAVSLGFRDAGWAEGIKLAQMESV